MLSRAILAAADGASKPKINQTGTYLLSLCNQNITWPNDTMNVTMKNPRLVHNSKSINYFLHHVLGQCSHSNFIAIDFLCSNVLHDHSPSSNPV
ncbi:hypothetical protein M758_10G075200 [Ceratodon purpureus]|nr:hypothetical protein M758_10G075200 [Ceratodon purpureus]